MRPSFSVGLALLMLCAGAAEALGASNLPLDLGRFRILAPEREMPVVRLSPPVDMPAVRQDTQPAATIVIKTAERYLYLVRGDVLIRRYKIGVGRPGFTWLGVQTVSAKKEWPDWTPPEEMIRRQPSLPRTMSGGPGNPLGARALYLGSTLYRIHGSNMPETIGQAASSGCFRMTNDDVIDLYKRVEVGTRVVVFP